MNTANDTVHAPKKIHLLRKLGPAYVQRNCTFRVYFLDENHKEREITLPVQVQSPLWVAHWKATLLEEKWLLRGFAIFYEDIMLFIRSWSTPLKLEEYSTNGEVQFRVTLEY